LKSEIYDEKEWSNMDKPLHAPCSADFGSWRSEQDRAGLEAFASYDSYVSKDALAFSVGNSSCFTHGVKSGIQLDQQRFPRPIRAFKDFISMGGLGHFQVDFSSNTNM